MNRIPLRIIFAAAASFMLFGAKSALAIPLVCDGADVAGHCDITALQILPAGTYETPAGSPVLHINGGELRVAAGATLTLNIAGSATDGLIIENGGKITGNDAGAAGNGATLNITVTLGDILLTSGATISAANTGTCGAGNGGVINIKANGANANITTEDGTTISVNGGNCPAGAINISAPTLGSIDIDGDVLAQGFNSGSGSGPSGTPIPTGGTQRPGGGPIFITASCNLTISDTGVVSSKGADPGADLVHLEGGCDVLINGLVESTGVGHVTPGNPPNSCSNVIPRAGSVRRNPATRPGKPFNSTACVEVWAGNSLIINRTSALHGEINADTGHSPGGSQGTSWIDLFARGDIKILNTTAQWAVHANGNAGTDNGGVVTVKTAGTGPVTSPGNIILNGLALQASATAHGKGGTVDVEATLDVNLRAINISNVDGKVQAKGGLGAPADDGGRIVLFSQKNILAGAASNLNVTGAPTMAGATGGVDLKACGTIDFPPGTITPAGATVNKSPATCPTPVSFETYVVLPLCTCGNICIPCPT